MKVYNTITDEMSSYERKYLFDKKKYDMFCDVRNKKTHLMGDIYNNDKEMVSLESMLKDAAEGSVNYKSIMNNLNDCVEKRKRMTVELKNLGKSLDALIKELPTSPYDKYQLKDNIRNYLERSGVALGELETESGMSKGGLSRWEKSIATSELPLSFILKASDSFGVTVYELLYGDALGQSDSDKKIIDFLGSLQELTDERKIKWEVIEPLDKRSNKLSYQNTGNLSRLYRDAEGVFFKSDFSFDYVYKANKKSYKAQFPDETGYIYIYSLKTDEENSKDVYEIYLNPNEGEEQAIYTTLLNNDVIDFIVRGLHVLADKSSKEIFLEATSVDAMDRLIKYAEAVKDYK